MNCGLDTLRKRKVQSETSVERVITPMMPMMIVAMAYSEPTLGAKGLPTTPLFGSSLEEAIRMSHIPGTPMVPAILVRCAEFLEAKGIDEVGLYR
ncbi:hypothetical protein BGZ90_009179, partial [Linnemannia elongata]